MDKQNMLYPYTMEYYTALKRKEVLTQAAVGMNFEDITLSEISLSLKGRYCVIPPTRGMKSSRRRGWEVPRWSSGWAEEGRGAGA